MSNNSRFHRFEIRNIKESNGQTLRNPHDENLSH